MKDCFFHMHSLTPYAEISRLVVYGFLNLLAQFVNHIEPL